MAGTFRLSDFSSRDFSPSLLSLVDTSPNPLGRKLLWCLLSFLAAILIWATLGNLDIVAVARGKLIPQSYVKIIQPVEAGIVREILAKEGGTVSAGQILMRMDALVSEADAKSLEADSFRKRLTLRRIDAELGGKSFAILDDDPPALAREIEAQYRANRAALSAALAEERSRLLKATQEMAAAEQVKRKLADTLPHYREQELAFEKLAKDGFAGPLMASDKRRERVEREQELRTQEFFIESARASIHQSEKKLLQLESDYRRHLHAERNDVQSQATRLEQEIVKQSHRRQLLELRAPQDGIVKDLATHTIGTVVQPGTVLLTLVPREETLRAEVWISNEDIGFVFPGQSVKLKLAAFPFQKYGMLDGTVEHIGADATDASGSAGPASGDRTLNGQALFYKALVALPSSRLHLDKESFPLAAGMQTNAEIKLGQRSVLEYLLSPVRKAWHEAGRER